jgi:hypothetical protein
VRKARLGVFLVGLVLVLAACGRVAPTSSATSSPSPAEFRSSAPTRLAIPGPSFHVGEVGLAYTPVAYQATGGNAPYIWRVSDGALPGGLSISSDGVISGTPTASGSFTFAVEVTDAGIATADVSGSIKVMPKLTVGVLHSTVTARQGSAAAGAFASQAGGNPPYSYSVTSGSLPVGTSLHGLSLVGIYSSTGTYHFTVTVTDSLGAPAAVRTSFYVWGPIAFPPCLWTRDLCPPQFFQDKAAYYDVECRGTTAAGCTAQFPYSGGTPGVTPTIQYWTATCFGGDPGTCPDRPLNGLTVSVYGGALHVSVAANSSNPEPWIGKVYVVLTDPQTHELTRAAVFEILI